MQINVEVGEIDLNTAVGEKKAYDEDGYNIGTEPETLGDAVIAEVTRHLLKRSESAMLGDLPSRISRVRDEEIRAKVGPLVESAIEAGIQKTNSYGEPVGQPTTLRELIVKEVHDYIGKRASSDYRNGTTVIQKWLQQEIGKAFQTELAAVLADEKAKVVAAVRAKGAELIAEAVKQGLGR